MSTIRNSQRSVARACLAIFACACLVAVYPHLFHVDKSDIAVFTFFGLLVAVSAAIPMFAYFARARLADRILTDEHLLAHWSYSDEQWRKYIADEFEVRKTEWLVGWIILSVLAALMGSVFALSQRRGYVVLLYCLGFIPVLGIFVVFVPWLQLRPLRTNPHEVHISEHGLLIAGKLFTWRGPRGRLENVTVTGEAEKMLEFKYSYPSRVTRHETIVHIPIPRRAEAKAEEIRRFFGKDAGLTDQE